MFLSGVAAGFALLFAPVQDGGRRQANGPSPPEEAGVELLLLDVLYDHLRLESALAVLQDARGRRYLPLRQFSNTLGYRVRVDASHETGAGFLNDPVDSFELNGPAGTCRRKASFRTFDPLLCFSRDGDVYVDAELLSHVAGLKLTWQLNRLELDVESETVLPVVKRWMERRRIETPSSTKPEESMRLLSMPYEMWTRPTVDLRWYTDAELDDASSRASSRLQADGRGDLLFMDGRYRFISAGNGHPASTLISLGREDPRSGLLGPLHASRFSLGDLTLPQIPLFARPRTGLGISLTNFPLSGSGRQGESIHGQAPPGSVVELYRDRDLIASARSDSKGAYELPISGLERGPNDLRVVVLTPEGDVSVDRRTAYGDVAGPAAGQSQYRLSLAKVGESLIPHGLADVSDEQKRVEALGEYRLGLTKSTWLSTTAAETWAHAGGGGFLGVGLNSWSGKNLWHVQGLASDHGTSALAAGISRRFGDVTMSLEQTLATRGFNTALSPEIGADATSVTRLRVDGSFSKGQRPLSYGLSVDRFNGSTPSTLLRGRLSGGYGRSFASATFAARVGDHFEGSGLLQVRTPVGPSIGRVDLGYAITGPNPIQTARLSLDRSISPDYRLRFGFEYDAIRRTQLQSIASVYRLLGPLAVGLNLAVDARGSIKGNLLLSVGVEGEEAAHALGLAHPGTTEAGTASVRVFLDRNCNGVYDAGDAVLPDVGIRVNGRAAIAKSGKDGRCFLDRLPANQEVKLTLNEDTLDDPCWAAEAPGFIIVPRPGRLARLDFPVIESAEIEGKVQSQLATEASVAQLVDWRSKVVDTSVLDTDGTYVFSRVRPGDYTIRLVETGGQILAGRPIKVAPGALLKGIDFKDVTKSG